MTPAASSEERSREIPRQARRCAIEKHGRKNLRCQSAGKTHAGATNGCEAGNTKQGPGGRTKPDVRGSNRPGGRKGLSEDDGEVISHRNRVGSPCERNHDSSGHDDRSAYQRGLRAGSGQRGCERFPETEDDENHARNRTHTHEHPPSSRSFRAITSTSRSSPVRRAREMRTLSGPRIGRLSSSACRSWGSEHGAPENSAPYDICRIRRVSREGVLQ